MKSTRLLLGLLLVCAALTACESGRETLPNATAYSINAAPSYLAIQFRREERGEPPGNPPLPLGFREARRHSFDAETYEFNFDAQPPGQAVQRIASVTQTLSEQNTYYFLVTEDPAGDVEALVVEKPAFDASSSSSEVMFLHAAAALGPVDVYLEPPDADPAAATPRGSIGYGEEIDAAAYAAGEYRLTLTEPGSPAAVVFRSSAFEAAAGQDNLLVIADDGGQTTAAATVLRVNETPAQLSDLSAPAALRVVNGARDRAERDVVLDDDFAAPLFAALPFGTEVDYETVAPGEHDLTVTPAGNPGVLELESPISFERDYYTFIFGGDASSGLSSVSLVEDRRRIAGAGRLRALNAATQFERLDFLVVTPGSSLADAEAQSQLAQLEPFQTGDLAPVLPGDYELGLRESGTSTIVAGPVAVTLTERSLYSIVALDGPDTTSAELLLLDDFE